MTRQVAIGAIVAFALTVLALSLVSPRGEAPPPPTPAPTGAAAPIVATSPKDHGAAQLMPTQVVEVRQTTTIGPRLLQRLQLEGTDAGTAPTP
jgi:hypothetical protein